MQQNNVIWTSKSVEETIEKMRFNIPTSTACFHERDTDLKAANIAFRFTEWEEQEFVKCSTDIVYFVENYCKFLTDRGMDLVQLREFQRDILDTLGEEEYLEDIDDFAPIVRDYILMASRQSGKCLSFNTLVTIYNKSTGNAFDIEIGNFFIILSKLNRKKTLKQKIIDKIKAFLYKIYNKL